MWFYNRIDTQSTHTRRPTFHRLSLCPFEQISFGDLKQINHRLSIVSSRTQIYIDFLDLVGFFRFGLYLFGAEGGIEEGSVVYLYSRPPPGYIFKSLVLFSTFFFFRFPNVITSILGY